MHVISRKKIADFSAIHPDAKTNLETWYRIVRTTNFRNAAHLRSVFPSADPVGNLTVFNIGGNKYRLIAAIHYNRRKVYIRHILTHTEYDRNIWKRDIP